MDQALAGERIGYERHPSGVLEIVHVLGSVGINARDQRHRARQIVEILPVDPDSRGAGDRRQVDRVIGRSTGRDEADHRVHDRFLVDDLAEWTLACPAQFRQAMHRRPGQRLAKRRTRIDERRIGDVQPHQLHHHLVGIGGAVKGAGAGRMVRRRFRLQ